MRVEEKHANAKEKGCEKGIAKSGPGFPAFFEAGEKGGIAVPGLDPDLPPDAVGVDDLAAV